MSPALSGVFEISFANFEDTKTIHIKVGNLKDGVYSKGIVVLNSWMQVSEISRVLRSSAGVHLNKMALVLHGCFKLKCKIIKTGIYLGGSVIFNSNHFTFRTQSKDGIYRGGFVNDLRPVVISKLEMYDVNILTIIHFAKNDTVRFAYDIKCQ